MLKVKLLHPDAKVPTRANETDAGLDLYADQSATIQPRGGRALVSAGISISIPAGYVGFIWPRSGLAVSFGLDVMAGVIDSSYRGEVKVALINHHSGVAFSIRPGDRIAQLVIQKVELWNPLVVDELDDTERGVNGFGSSGK